MALAAITLRGLFMTDVNRDRIPSGEAVFTGLLFFAKMKQSKISASFSIAQSQWLSQIFRGLSFCGKGTSQSKKRFPIFL